MNLALMMMIFLNLVSCGDSIPANESETEIEITLGRNQLKRFQVNTDKIKGEITWSVREIRGRTKATECLLETRNISDKEQVVFKKVVTHPDCTGFMLGPDSTAKSITVNSRYSEVYEVCFTSAELRECTMVNNK